MPTEPTLSLHDLLREAGNQPYEGEHPMYTYRGITLTDLATIQKQIEDAATAPLRTELAEMENDRDRWKVRRHDGGRLWSKLRDASRRVYHDSTPNFSTQFALTVAEVNAIEWELLGAYDAADRAGEETPMPAQVDARDSVASDLVAYVEAMLEDEDGAITEEDRTKIGDMTLQYHALGLSAVPSPTDAAEGDADLQARPDTERITDLVTRADAAHSRLDMHMRRLDAMERWGKDATDRLRETAHDLRSLRKLTKNHSEALEHNTSTFNEWSAKVDASIAKIVDKVDGFDNAFDGVLIGLGADIAPYGDPPAMNKEQIIAALDAARTPVPEVTDAMLDAFAATGWSISMGNPETRESIRTGIAAALAAGGAK